MYASKIEKTMHRKLAHMFLYTTRRKAMLAKSLSVESRAAKTRAKVHAETHAKILANLFLH